MSASIRKKKGAYGTVLRGSNQKHAAATGEKKGVYPVLGSRRAEKEERIPPLSSGRRRCLPFFIIIAGASRSLTKSKNG